jgi:hypothetical protein
MLLGSNSDGTCAMPGITSPHEGEVGNAQHCRVGGWRSMLDAAVPRGLRQPLTRIADAIRPLPQGER